MGTIRTGANRGFSGKAGSIIGSKPDIRKQSQTCLCNPQQATRNPFLLPVTGCLWRGWTDKQNVNLIQTTRNPQLATRNSPATRNSQQSAKLIGIVLIILGLGACRTDKFLNTEKTRSSDLSATNTRIEELKHETYRASQMISLNDSNDHYYRINIFPVDSFSFSVQQGFRGRASRMEIVGSAMQITKLAEKRDLLAAKQDYSTQSQVNKSRKVSGSNSKVLEKSKSGGEWALIWLGLAGLIVLTAWKFWKK